jgi:hypothetical protein
VWFGWLLVGLVGLVGLVVGVLVDWLAVGWLVG